MSSSRIVLPAVSFLVAVLSFPPFAAQAEVYGTSNSGRGAQWYLNDYGSILSGGRTVYGTNVDKIGNQYAGSGTKIGVVDEGIDDTHPDLSGQVSPSISYDPADGAGTGQEELDPKEPVPVPLGIQPDDPSQRHGTYVAGVIGAKNDTTGIVGVASNATLGSLYLRLGSNFRGTPDIQKVFAYIASSSIDVSNNSWGYTQSFADNPFSSSFVPVFAELKRGVEQGRGGLGHNWVFAAGNSRLQIVGDPRLPANTNEHGLNGSRYVINAAV